MGLFLRRNHLLRCWVDFLFQIGLGLLYCLVAETASEKISSKKISPLSPEVALYLYLMEYCCHVWAGTPSCYLELLDKLEKRICRTIGP